jgi:hypothetical protein
MAGPDFRVELDLGGGIMVPLVLTEADISKSRNPAVLTLLEKGDRNAFRSAGGSSPPRRSGSPGSGDPTIKQGERAFGFTADRLEGN